jgi:hypothetical protein
MYFSTWAVGASVSAWGWQIGLFFSCIGESMNSLNMGKLMCLFFMNECRKSSFFFILSPFEDFTLSCHFVAISLISASYTLCSVICHGCICKVTMQILIVLFAFNTVAIFCYICAHTELIRCCVLCCCNFTSELFSRFGSSSKFLRHTECSSVTVQWQLMLTWAS